MPPPCLSARQRSMSEVPSRKERKQFLPSKLVHQRKGFETKTAANFSNYFFYQIFDVIEVYKFASIAMWGRAYS